MGELNLTPTDTGVSIAGSQRIAVATSIANQVGSNVSYLSSEGQNSAISLEKNATLQTLIGLVESGVKVSIHRNHHMFDKIASEKSLAGYGLSYSEGENPSKDRWTVYKK